MDLRRLSIVNPCPESWASMDGDARRRYCGRCRQSVHDLSSMTELEATRFLRGRRGQPTCIRFARDGDGGVRFAAAGPVAAAFLAQALSACAGFVDEDVEAPRDGVCLDIGGYEVDCDELGYEVIPSTPPPSPVPTVTADEDRSKKRPTHRRRAKKRKPDYEQGIMAGG